MHVISQRALSIIIACACGLLTSHAVLAQHHFEAINDPWPSTMRMIKRGAAVDLAWTADSRQLAISSHYRPEIDDPDTCFAGTWITHRCDELPTDRRGLEVVAIDTGIVRQYQPQGSAQPVWLDATTLAWLDLGNDLNTPRLLVKRGRSRPIEVKTARTPRTLAITSDGRLIINGSHVLDADSLVVQRERVEPDTHAQCSQTLGNKTLLFESIPDQLPNLTGPAERIHSLILEEEGKRTVLAHALLVSGPTTLARACFSPDGRWIAYIRQHHDDTFEVRIIATPHAEGPPSRQPIHHATTPLARPHAPVMIPPGLVTLGWRPESDLAKHEAACKAGGSKRCQETRFVREHGQVDVAVEAFAMDAYEVSRGMYDICVREGTCAAIDEQTCEIYDGNDWQQGRALPLASRHIDAPRTCITRAEAKTYCEWRDGTLPTEAQWAWAASQPTPRMFSWGDTWDASRVVANTTTMIPVTALSEGATPNGLLHMSGNAYEWVQGESCTYEEWEQQASLICTKGTTDSQGVVRGGSFVSDSGGVRTNYRRFTDPHVRIDTHGFRCAYNPNVSTWDTLRPPAPHYRSLPLEFRAPDDALVWGDIVINGRSFCQVTGRFAATPLTGCVTPLHYATNNPGNIESSTRVVIRATLSALLPDGRRVHSARTLHYDVAVLEDRLRRGARLVATITPAGTVSFKEEIPP